MTEHEMAVELMKWVGYNLKLYPFLKLFHHVANEGKRHPKISKEGMLSGLPDYHLPVSDGVYCGLWIELKAPNKKPTAKQYVIMNILQDHGNYVFWTDSLQIAIDGLKMYCDRTLKTIHLRSLIQTCREDELHSWSKLLRGDSEIDA